MKTAQILLVVSTLTTAPAYAEDCLNHVTDLSAEDVSIIASARPSAFVAPATLIAQPDSTHILHAVPDHYGRMGAEDLSQIESVQPQDKKIVLCPRVETRHN